jgi:hypothetical protein
MSEITVKTDNKWKELKSGDDIPDKIWEKEFDYLKEFERASNRFFKYRKVWYDTGEFMRVDNMPNDNPLSKWHGYYSDSFFSGVVIKLDFSDDRYIVGRFYS